MDFNVQSTATGSTGIGASPSSTVNKPSGTIDGDTLFLFAWSAVQLAGTCTLATPSGWTLVRTDFDSTSTCRLYVFSKIASTEPSTYTFTFATTGGTADTTVGTVMVRVTSVNTIPLGASNSAVDTAATTSNSFSETITPTISNSLIFFTVLGISNGTASRTAFAIATDNPVWTKIVDQSQSTSVPNAATFSLAYALRPQVTSTGIATCTTNQVSSRVLSQLISINRTQSVPFNAVDISHKTDVGSIKLKALFMAVETSHKTDDATVVKTKDWTNPFTKNSTNWSDQNKS